MNTSRVRRQVYELRIEDLRDHPVWEFALDEEDEEDQDEATVRPVDSSVPVDPSAGMFIVRANFTFADGTKATGYITPPPTSDEDLGTIQPQIVALGGQVGLWCGMLVPEPQQIKAFYALLGKSKGTEVFPLQFVSDVPLAGGPIAGTVPGFLVLEDLATMKTRTLI
jgi:hypothetical protein